MKVKDDKAYREFIDTVNQAGWPGVRIKQIRHEPLSPGGRVRLTLFEAVEGNGRPHPRLRVSMPPAVDPNPPGGLFGPESVPPTAMALRDQIEHFLRTHDKVLSAADLDMSRAPKGSPRYFQHSIRVQRIAAFFAEVRQALASWIAERRLASEDERAFRRVIRELEDEIYATTIEFDDHDMGTYFSYLHDQAFVHYLEAVLQSLPEEGSTSLALLSGEAQHAVRRQREQITNHIDHLMRHKYAFKVIEETNIEETLGGFLIDRATRLIVSEVPDASSLVPRYELVRVDPGAPHEHAGQWVYRDGKGGIHLQDGTAITVDASLLRASPRKPEELTFRRAPNDPRLRTGIRFDWDRNGWVQAGPIEWVSWAGHCDVQAVMEELGIVLADEPSLTEYRSDTAATTRYDRELLLEMIASVLELGSLYRRADSTGLIERGERQFGGARNDSRPDRLQLEGDRKGRHYRWPVDGREESFRITSIAWPRDDDYLDKADMGTIFFQYLPNLETIDFKPNPHFINTVEGDYNLIDVTGARLEATLLIDEFDEKTGYPRQRKQTTVIDLRSRPAERRCFLGTHMHDVASRRLYRVYLDRDRNRIVAELHVYEQREGKWQPRKLEDEAYVVPLASSLRCTLSHEMRRDNPGLYQALVDVALRRAENICADTDRTSPVWNGVVTRLEIKKTGENQEARVQRWSTKIRARFGRAHLDYLVRRDEAGEPVEYCPATPEDSRAESPDFLWQDFPDIGSKGALGKDWIVNDAMLQRKLIFLQIERSAPGGFYVYDDHIKNVFEIIYTALAGFRHSIVHENKRYGFRTEDEWKAAVAELERRRAALSFEAG